MSSPTQTWQDRRGMFQKGKELHEPARKPSISTGSTGSTTGTSGVSDAIRRASVSSSDGLDRTTSNTSTGDSPSGKRRMSSSAGMFGKLTDQKRGSQDYGDRRASHHEQSAAAGGVFSSWYHSTFRGGQGKPAAGEGAAVGEVKKGVMEG